MNNSISIIVATRNDNHGGNLIERTNTFLNSLALKLKKFDFRVELIIVEWNQIPENPPISQTLDFKNIKLYADVKIITIKKELHDAIANSDKIHFFQMIAKNAGIRRASGEFILCTNIDILLNDNLVTFLKNSQIHKKTLYRLARHDLSVMNIDSQDILEDQNQLDQLVCFKNKINYSYDVRTERRHYANSSLKRYYYNSIYSIEDYGFFQSFLNLFNKLKKFKILNLKKYLFFILKAIKYKLFYPKLFTNACGDFTLLDKESWHALNGYSEIPLFSWHLDSIFLWQAYFGGIKFYNFEDDIYVYHLAHHSGGSVPDLAKMYEKLNNEKIPFIQNNDFPRYLEDIKNKKFNFLGINEKFGLYDEKLEITKLN